MAHEHRGRSRAGALRQDLAEDLLTGVVEAGEGLIEEQQPRLGKKGPREREALRGPARQGPRPPVGGAVESEALELSVDASGGKAMEAGEEAEVLPRRQVEVDERIVRDEAD